jgi:hypothetical protein
MVKSDPLTESVTRNLFKRWNLRQCDWRTQQRPDGHKETLVRSHKTSSSRNRL